MELRNKIIDSMTIVHPEWMTIFSKFRKELEDALTPLKDIDTKNICPPIERIFSTFVLNPEHISVVIIGQDPYPTKGEACGLSFSCDIGEPKSFLNIKNCLEKKGYTLNNADLRSWLYQGVLLLNMSLTTEVGKKNVHKDSWKPFTTSIISELTNRYNGITFMLWGRDAQSIKPYINGNQFIREWTHPSPMADNVLSINKKFINCDNFDDIDINWNTGEPIHIYTDGGVELHKKASYAVYIPNMLRLYGLVIPSEYLWLGNKLLQKEDTSIEPTSQRGEYLAICMALTIIKRLNMRNVILVTDSANSKGILTEWTKKKTEKYKNPDLVSIMRGLYEPMKDRVEVIHTPSHNKDPTSPYNEGNNVVDKIATYALRKLSDFETHVDFQKVDLHIL